ncbi:MAG: rhomboid family intramembrane serine protease [Bacteroidia bacterium]|nr:rhomboid family intramembrane serine protease [Bacteroidia bacterium]
MRNTSSKLFFSILYPLLFVAILWLVKLFELAFDFKFFWYGIFPRTLNGLTGIAFAPLIHSNLDHLISNSIPLFLLGTIMFYFYRSIAFKVFFWIYIMTNVWVWVAARSSYHIGASGVLYGFVCFLFFSGIFRKDTKLMAISLFVTFLYGSMTWGIFPIFNGVSWESHLLGSIAGIITAYNFRKEGPQAKKYDWGTDEENELIDVSGEQENSDNNDSNTLNIQYTFIQKDEKAKD